MTQNIVPDFYKNFVCAAGDCPDTCCKDWDIEVDGDTLDFYNNYPELSRHIMTDKDGDDVIKFEGGVCPFLTQRGLCAVQERFGEDKICLTCREFPRIVQDYTVFAEYLLTLACPQTAFDMVISHDTFSFITDSRVPPDTDEYDADLMNCLLHTRYLIAEIFRSGGNYYNNLSRVLSFCESVQEMIDRDCFDIAAVDNIEIIDFSNENTSQKDIFLAHEGLDVMDKSWLENVLLCSEEKLPIGLDEEFASFSLYYIARYYLLAISTYDIITTIKRLFCAVVVCGCMISHEKARNDAWRRAVIYQKYSKEIEHSDENTQVLTDVFLTEPFESKRLAAMLPDQTRANISSVVRVG